MSGNLLSGFQVVEFKSYVFPIYFNKVVHIIGNSKGLKFGNK